MLRHTLLTFDTRKTTTVIIKTFCDHQKMMTGDDFGKESNDREKYQIDKTAIKVPGVGFMLTQPNRNHSVGLV